MATSMPSNFAISFPAPLASTASASRRRIPPEAGRALEILGHAIEYLTDEFVHHRSGLSSTNPELQAIQLLMGLNRQVYFACPVVPSLGERLRSMLHLDIA